MLMNMRMTVVMVMIPLCCRLDEHWRRWGQDLARDHAAGGHCRWPWNLLCRRDSSRQFQSHLVYDWMYSSWWIICAFQLLKINTQLARKGIIWTSIRCSRAWTVNKPNKSTVVCAVCLLFWHFPHLSTSWKFSRYILCTRMWRPGESFNKEWCKTHENSFFFAMQFLSVASLELDGKI